MLGSPNSGSLHQVTDEMGEMSTGWVHCNVLGYGFKTKKGLCLDQL